ncbi:MAG: Stk1 family PASTA domain-containing Ser/Thr kinase [Actinomycetota bacterium]
MSEGNPTVFGGRYELHRRLARGGMADVFLARDQLLGRPVAVKVLFPEFATDPKFVERFRREAQAAAGLNHPNIVSIYDWGAEMGTYYIVMEYVEGQSLAQILRRDKILSAEQVTRVALDVSQALGFAHEGGVVHRDVKPGNVLVSPKGEMKVADFGIATALTANADANLTQTGAVMGTATYFSPEQAQGHKVDRRSDLYSLGVVMYEMLTGTPPFTGETPVSIAYKHVQEPVIPVSERGVEIPRALSAITMKLLSKNADNRYPTAEALLADLDRFRQGQAIAAAAAVAPPAGAVAAPMQQTAALPAQPGPGAYVASPQSPGAGVRMIPATYTPPPRRRGGLIFAGLLMSILILAGFLILLQRNFNTGTDSEADFQPTVTEVVQAEVPSVGGRGEADARSTLEARGFTVDRRLIADDQVPAGQVILTEPAAGSRLDQGSTVTMVISTGANANQVPSVATLTENQALQTLQGAGFLVSIERITSSVAPEGEVVGQDPPANSLLARGETVTIQVSAGTEEIPVPDVAGQELDAARDFLEAEGFAVEAEFDLVFDDIIPMGAVIETEPPAGTPLPPGTTIRIVLSDGPENLFLPSWLGVEAELAFIEMQEAGLVPLEFPTIVQDPNFWGRVVDTIPGPNTPVTPGMQIQVLVGRPDPNAGAPPIGPTPDPNLGGQGDGTDTGNGFDG